MKALCFVPTTATPESEADARVLSLAIHAFMSAIIVGRAFSNQPEMTVEERKILLAGRMDTLVCEVMELYPTADGTEEILDIADRHHLHCTLMGRIQ